jgi:hypothetical protein
VSTQPEAGPAGEPFPARPGPLSGPATVPGPATAPVPGAGPDPVTVPEPLAGPGAVPHPVTVPETDPGKPAGAGEPGGAGEPAGAGGPGPPPAGPRHPGRTGAGAYWTGMVILVAGLAATVAVLATRVTSLVQTVVVAVPLVLVGVGLERLGKGVRRGSLRTAGALLVLLAVAAPVVLSLSSPGAEVDRAEGGPVPAGAAQAVLRVSLASGRLRVGPGATGLYDAQLRAPAAPSAEVTTSGSTAVVDLRSPGQHGLLARNRGSDWSARLSTSLPWKVEVDGGALTADLDLRDLEVRGVGVTTGVSRLAVRLGQPVGQVRVDLRVSAGLVDLYLPRTAAVELRVHGLAANNFAAQGLHRGAGGWRSGDTRGPDRYLVGVRAATGRVRVHRG